MRTGRPVARVLVDRSPGDVILSRDGRLAFVSHYDLLRFIGRDPARPETGYSKIAIVDTATMQLRSLTAVCPTAHGMGLDAAQRLLYITCSLSDELAVLDISDPAAPRLQGRVHRRGCGCGPRRGDRAGSRRRGTGCDPVNPDDRP